MSNTSNGSALAKKEQGIRAFLHRMTKQVNASLPDTLDSKRLFASVVAACQKMPQLFDCNPASMQNAVLQAAFAGWEVAGPHAKAHLIPFKGQVTLIPNYRGLLDAMMRSGQVATVSARVVHERDSFEIEYSQTPPYRHTPHLGKDPGCVIGAYADVRMKDGSTKFEFMTTSEIDAVKAMSPAAKKKDSPWNTGPNNWGEMAKKTVIRRVSKQCPFSSEDLRLINAEVTEPEEAAADPVINITADVADTPAREQQPQPDPERAAMVEQLTMLEQAHPGLFAAAMDGAPALSDLSDEDLRASIAKVRRAIDADESANGSREEVSA